MFRFYVDETAICGDLVVIEGSDVNHIRNVLRMKQGDRVIVNSGLGTDYYCIIREVFSEQIELQIESSKPCNAELPVKLVLFQALPKLDKMELIIQKAVELGAYEIVPVVTKRCVVKLDEKKSEKKLARWQSIAEAAAKQSARGIIPQVRQPLKFKEAVKYAGDLEYLMIPFEHAEGMVYSRQIMKEAAKTKSVGIFIGPEGGFEDEEIEYAKEAGARVISLGNRILRTETAGITVLSILMFQLSD